MQLTLEEKQFLTALAREQNQTGCRGPAHDLLRKHVCPDSPQTGPGSLAFSYEAIPLVNLLLKDAKDLEEIDEFLRGSEIINNPRWPWSSSEEYKFDWKLRAENGILLRIHRLEMGNNN